MFAIVLFFCGVWIAGDFNWQTWNPEAKAFGAFIWIVISGMVFMSNYD